MSSSWILLWGVVCGVSGVWEVLCCRGREDGAGEWMLWIVV